MPSGHPPPADHPPPRVSPEDPNRDEILRRHRAAEAGGAPGYEDPATGFFVFTAAALSERGSCCGSGCRHCPYGRRGVGAVEDEERR